MVHKGDEYPVFQVESTVFCGSLWISRNKWIYLYIKMYVHFTYVFGMSEYSNDNIADNKAPKISCQIPEYRGVACFCKCSEQVMMGLKPGV